MIHILMVPDNEQTWIGVGGDEAALASKLTFTIGGPSNDLGARPDLASLTMASVGAGGFVTVSGLIGAGFSTELAVNGILGEHSPMRKDDLPKHAGAPIVFSVTPGRASAPLSVTARVSSGFIQDVLDAFAREP